MMFQGLARGRRWKLNFWFNLVDHHAGRTLLEVCYNITGL
jgi:hypothetical protein